MRMRWLRANRGGCRTIDSWRSDGAAARAKALAEFDEKIGHRARTMVVYRELLPAP